MEPIIYFDNAASTQLSEEVIQVMTDCMHDVYGNPSSVHEYGRRARVVVEQSRRTIAKLFSTTSSEIYFTSGGTEANNAILWACCKDLGRRSFISGKLEHPAVLKSLTALKKIMDVGLHFVRHTSNGHICLDHLEELLKENPGSVVSLMHANNEIGNLLPVKSVSALCTQYDALFHSDAVQTVGKLHIDFSGQFMDFAAASAHKFHGPKGVGFMYVKKGHSITPFISGGGQEREMRAGTENVYGIAGMAKALELAYLHLESDQKHITSLKQNCITLLQEKIPGVDFHGDPTGSSLHTILNISLPPGKKAEMLMPALDIRGICVSSGSACSSGSVKKSSVMQALDTNPERPSIRVSFSRYNTFEEVHRFVQNLSDIYQSS
jgi:cysteine desulfurase